MPEEHSTRRRLARDVVMVALAIASIAILAEQEFGAPDPALDAQLLVLDLGIVAVFWVEYAVRLRAHKDKRAFVKANWYDLPGMIPVLPGMEAIGGVRLLRLLRVLRILRLLGALRRFDRFNRFASRFIGGSKLGYVALLALAIIATCSTLAWTFEPETFPTLPDALWWGVVTATTVGYGDFTPRGGVGRSVAVVLMFLGVALIGTFAATLSSALVDRRFGAGEGQAGIAGELERLARLRERGQLSEQEFARAKEKLLE